jgi:hypothetical protein
LSYRFVLTCSYDCAIFNINLDILDRISSYPEAGLERMIRAATPPCQWPVSASKEPV